MSADENDRAQWLTLCPNRTLVYLEGDATMRTFDDMDGKKQTALSLVQTRIEVLKRPTPTEADNAEAVAEDK